MAEANQFLQLRHEREPCLHARLMAPPRCHSYETQNDKIKGGGTHRAGESSR